MVNEAKDFDDIYKPKKHGTSLCWLEVRFVFLLYHWRANTCKHKQMQRRNCESI